MRLQTNAAELAVEGVSVRFGGIAAISDVSFTFGRHEIFGLIGPNGAGKTTLVNCLTGFQRPTAGRVLVGRNPADGWDPAQFRRAGIGRTFQAGRLFKEMTVRENVEVTALGLGLGRRAARSHVAEIIDWVGIGPSADRIAGALPYTEERRVGIARALVLSPAFVLLDEPAAGMSDHECDDLMRLVSAIPSEHRCGVLLIEHNMRVVMGVCDRIHVLDGGRTLAEGTPAAVRANPAVISAYLGEAA
ncbi:ABC transporter ATP-binding protein [Shinella sp.]|uniref:ABC transporter ATP-binding protein n=1 Tax=Shinella sp. TaxID=1870904 RepID=UPI0039E252DF